MNPNNEPTFFDKRTVLAMIFVFGGIMGWNYYLSKKYPSQKNNSSTTVAEKKTTRENVQEKQSPESAPQTEKSQGTKSEATYKFDNSQISFELSSRGMGIKNVLIKSHTQRDGTSIVLGENLEGHSIFETQYGSEVVEFFITSLQDGSFLGTAEFGETKIFKKIIPQKDSNKILISTTIENPKHPLSLILAENISKSKSSSFLLPSYDFESLYVAYEGTNKKIDIKEDSEQISTDAFSNVSVASLGGHYFTTALVDKSAVAPTVTTLIKKFSKKVAVAFLNYNLVDPSKTYELNQTAYIGPKSVSALEAVDPQLKGVVSFGIFSWIANPILWLLKFFHSLVGNYGVAIILVTLLIRALLMPINISSYKSMKAMQQVQPLLKAAKEKYKKDPQRLQQETMNIMRANKVNPLGGCLPMFLQLPVFIALYNVLAQSIELYQAPFAFWIHDLSSKDPFYVLPILMGVSMYLQQKITPTTMDPAQAKVMQFMPVIFSFMMIGLPSGLTLYIFVSTIFGVVQQYMFMNEKKNNKNTITINAK